MAKSNQTGGQNVDLRPSELIRQRLMNDVLRLVVRTVTGRGIPVMDRASDTGCHLPSAICLSTYHDTGLSMRLILTSIPDPY